MKKTLMFLIAGGLLACGGGKEPKEDAVAMAVFSRPEVAQPLRSNLKAEKAYMDAAMDSLKLTDIHKLNPRIWIDLKYAGSDNFMKMKLYKRLRTVYLQKDVAGRLSDCQHLLDSLHPGWHLLVYDGVRPLETQQLMWDALDSIPAWERSRFVSNPGNRSLHNYGAAVDVTICDKNGEPLDMGAGYDDMRKIAYPNMEAHFLQTGELTRDQIDNRQLLRKIMRYRGFTPIESEWWHFNACSRLEAKIKYMLLEKEPR